MEKLKIIFTGGGTGGHVYPNIAIYEELREKYPDAEFLYVGHKKGAENKVVKNIPHPIDFVSVPSRGIPQKIKSLQTLVSLFYIFLGTIKSFFLLRKFKPHIVIGSGGYVSAPVLFAARLLKIKVFIHEQNAVPGRMNRFIARFASRVALSFASTARFFPEDRAVFTGYPLRRAIRFSKEADIKKKYAIPEKNKVVFIFGGSSGAKTINTAVAEIVPTLLSTENLTVILSTGRGYSKEYKAYDDTVKILNDIGVSPEVEGKLVVREYFDNIDEIYSIADLVISRAGAGSIKEITTLGIPSILIPKIDLPGDHQILNAREVEKAGGARIVYEEVRYRNDRRTIYVPEKKLLDTLREVVFDGDLLFNLRKNLLGIEKPNSSELILKEIEQVLKGHEKAEKKQVKVFYLHCPESEKNIELVFDSTTVGNSVLCDYRLDNTDQNVLVDLKMLSGGDKIVIRSLKGQTQVNGEEVEKWSEIKEGDLIRIAGKEFVLKSYYEKIEHVHIEKTTSSKILGSSLGIMISRLGGLFRQVVIAAYFGAGRVADIYVVGLTVSNFMRRIVAENALENAFLPIFSRLFHRSSRKKTWEAASSITNFNLLLSMLFTVGGIILAPFIIKTLFYPFAAKGMLDQTINMTRLILPYLFLVTVASVLTTYLKAFSWFGIAEASAIFFSLGTIAGIIFLHSTLGLYSIAVGILVGGMMQVFFLIPFVSQIFKNKSIAFNYKPVLNLTSSANKKYYSQLIPISIDVIMSRLNEIVAVFLASGLRIGSIAFLNFALTIFRLPFAVISQAVNSVVLKEFSDQIALFDKQKARQLFLDGIKTNLFLLTPVSILTILLAEPIVSLILERGRFDAVQVSNTALALQFYALGLIGWGIHSLTIRIFSARLDIKTSMLLNFFMLAGNVVLSVILVKSSLDFAGLALATSLSFLIFAALRIVVLKIKLEREEIVLEYGDILSSLAKTLFSALLMVIVLIQARFIFYEIEFGSKMVGNLVTLISLSFVGISIYLLSSLMLKNTEILIFKSRILRKEPGVPLSMLSPFRFLEKISGNGEAYVKDYFYKINIYLSSPGWEVRNVGVKLIGLFKDKSKIDYLVSVLKGKSENGFVRRNALNSLRELGYWNREAQDLLRSLLDDPYYEVRVAALAYLIKHAAVDDYPAFHDIVWGKFKNACLEEKLSCLKLVAAIGNQEDLPFIDDFYLSSNSLIREEVLELLSAFYKRKLLTAEEIEAYIGKILITSNNMKPEFKLKVIINKIYKEIEKG